MLYIYIVLIQNKLDYFTVFSKLSSSFRVSGRDATIPEKYKEKFDVLISSLASYIDIG